MSHLTFQDKSDGDFISAGEVNQIKSVVNNHDNRIVVLESNGASSGSNIPIGLVIDWPGPVSTITEDLHLCDGTSFLISEYNDLFKSLGGYQSPYGVNAEEGTFQIPLIEAGRTTIQRGASGITGYNFSLGQKGGAIKHELALSEMPWHYHDTFSSGRVNKGAGNGTGTVDPNSSGATPSPKTGYTGGNSSGATDPHNNMPPYICFNKVIKIKELANNPIEPTDISGKEDKLTAFNNQTSTSYTIALSDLSKYITMNNGNSNTVTVPPSSSVVFEQGTKVTIEQGGTGTTSIVAGTGVTINSEGGRMKLYGQYAVCELIYKGNNVWTLFGNLKA